MTGRSHFITHTRNTKTVMTGGEGGNGKMNTKKNQHLIYEEKYTVWRRLALRRPSVPPRRRESGGRVGALHRG